MRRLWKPLLVVVVLVALWAAYVVVLHIKYPRDEEAYAAGLDELSCNYADCREKTPCRVDRCKWREALRERMAADLDAFISDGDRACDWLESRFPRPLFLGSFAADLQQEYMSEEFEPRTTAALSGGDAPVTADDEKHERRLFYRETELAWKHLCRPTLQNRSNWPVEHWYDLGGD